MLSWQSCLYHTALTALVRAPGTQVQYSSPARPDWGGLVVTKPGTVTGLQLQVRSCDAPLATWWHLDCAGKG